MVGGLDEALREGLHFDLYLSHYNLCFVQYTGKCLACNSMQYRYQEVFNTISSQESFSHLVILYTPGYHIIYLLFKSVSRLSCAEIEVYHNVRHMFSEIYICGKFYI
jgi:hypothetical protein